MSIGNIGVNTTQNSNLDPTIDFDDAQRVKGPHNESLERALERIVGHAGGVAGGAGLLTKVPTSLAKGASTGDV